MESPASDNPRALRNAFDALSSAPSNVLRGGPWLPFVAIAALVAVIAALFIALLLEDRQLQRDALHRDTDSAARRVAARAAGITDALSNAAVAIGLGTVNEARLRALTGELLAARPEIQRIKRIDAAGKLMWSAPSSLPAGSPDVDPQFGPLIEQALRLHEPVYGVIESAGTPVSIAIAIPIFAPAAPDGALLARIAPNELLLRSLGAEAVASYRMTLLVQQRPIASTTDSEASDRALRYEATLAPLPTEFRLQATAFRQPSRLGGNALLWIVAILATAVVITLATLTRHTRRLVRAESALAAEAALRRAMEDSLATGLRVFDAQGVIRYVNKAFCQMTGYAAGELVGRSAPFPYWPPGQHEENNRNLDKVLSGQADPAGFEVVVRRKDGTDFDARMYVSPLVDDAGRQIGWLTSMADITEPKRIRNELAAAHDRFMKVLESLEAAVSVVELTAEDQPSERLMFANREYRQQFGDDAAGHHRLRLGLHDPESARSGEAYDAPTARWYDVRVREIRWVDGRQAMLQIATDITLRRATEDIVRQQQEKVQFTSRLMTMGEMASSLAHELNQPLTAINNYSQGLLERLRQHQVGADELRVALEKTSSQAQRAGSIIRRIREFVKRSEPRRREASAARIVDDAIGFAEIEAAKRRISIVAHIEPNLPPLYADPILVEQVLLNLMKNAADAMDAATVRRIDVHVRAVDGMAEFAVTDRGSGIPDEHLPNLFQPFFSTKSEGMGMGLKICRSIIEFHQGRLMIERNPEPAGGAIVRFTLPLATSTALADNPRLPTSPQPQDQLK